jgi:hypothetical protein
MYKNSFILLTGLNKLDMQAITKIKLISKIRKMKKIFHGIKFQVFRNKLQSNI